MTRRNPRKITAALSVAAVAAITLSACGGSGKPADSGKADDASSGGDSGASSEALGNDGKSFTVLIPNENPVLKEQLEKLSQGQCSAQNEALPIEFQSLAQQDVVQRITLLAGQGALPSHFIAGTAMVRPDGDLGQAGLVVDYSNAFGSTEAWDNVLPAAISTVENVYGHMVSLPYQYNLEGIWYNKQIFADNNIEIPATWDDLVEAAKTLDAAGVTPFTAGGGMGWPLTRYIGMYLNRSVGPDAMQKVMEGEAKLTDPEYVEAAQALVDLTSAGYFGQGFISTDADASNNDFLTGKAAMKYDGTWFLGNINDEAQNEIGAENIGFMAFPDVKGGNGNSGQWAANAGAAMAASTDLLGDKTSAWFECIMDNYGYQALQEAGVISGFKVNGEVTGIPDSTLEIQELIADIDEETVLWFEALMDPESNSLASSNVSLLATDQMSAEDYMGALQASIESAE